MEDIDDVLFGQNVDAVLEGVFDVQTAVEDLVRADPLADVLAEDSDLVRERLLVPREEDMTADVGAEPFPPKAPREAPGRGVGLEDLDILAEEVGREKTRDSAAKDAHVPHFTAGLVAGGPKLV